MNLARVVIKDLPWVTFELRTKKQKGRASQVQRSVSTKTQNPRERGRRKLGTFQELKENQYSWSVMIIRK